jgi:poly(A) polymerase
VVSRAEALDRLRNADWLQRPETQKLFAALDGATGRTRAVGGMVRDTLLGRRHGTDLDLATELPPLEVTARAGAAGIAAYPTGIDHGTVTLKAGDLVAEVTTLREDVETDGRHAVVRFGSDWARDAERRDFTMNALYAGGDGELFDPLGGLNDCLAGHVRFIGDPDRRIAEDRLRVYRFFRFSASHGSETFDAVGLAACQRAAGTLSGLSAERIGAEMRKLLALPKAAKTLTAMRDAGILTLPDTAPFVRYEQRADQPLLTGRLALFVAAADAGAVQARWRLANGEMRAVTDLLAAARLLVAGHFHEAAYRYRAVAADAVALAAALDDWTEDAVNEARLRLAGLHVPDFPVTAGDLMQLGLQPGPHLGSELKRLERQWIDSGFALDRATLLDEAKR